MSRSGVSSFSDSSGRCAVARSHENVGGAVRRDKEWVERQAFDQLKAELSQAFAVPESAYEALAAAEVIARNRT